MFITTLVSNLIRKANKNQNLLTYLTYSPVEFFGLVNYCLEIYCILGVEFKIYCMFTHKPFMTFEKIQNILRE